MYYSQCGEDKFLYENYFKDDETENGFFIELGAMDGVTYSNTLFYENQLGWNGVLIEPQVQMFRQLERNRPKCYNFNYAISEIDGEVVFTGYNAIGGVDSDMTDWYKKDHNWSDKDKYIVKSKPMKSVLKDVPISKVDLFSIDVEGGELSVLNTFDWNIHVRIILIEMTKYDPERNDKIRKLLDEKNFVFANKVAANEVWINKEDLR